jgi:hypothetical protein
VGAVWPRRPPSPALDPNGIIVIQKTRACCTGQDARVSPVDVTRAQKCVRRLGMARSRNGSGRLVLISASQGGSSGFGYHKRGLSCAAVGLWPQDCSPKKAVEPETAQPPRAFRDSGCGGWRSHGHAPGTWIAAPPPGVELACKCYTKRYTWPIAGRSLDWRRLPLSRPPRCQPWVFRQGSWGGGTAKASDLSGAGRARRPARIALQQTHEATAATLARQLVASRKLQAGARR